MGGRRLHYDKTEKPQSPQEYIPSAEEVQAELAKVQSEVAARLIGWSDANRKNIGDPRPRIDQEYLDRGIAAIKKKIGDDAFEIAYKVGRGLTLDEAVAIASSGKQQA